MKDSVSAITGLRSSESATACKCLISVAGYPDRLHVLPEPYADIANCAYITGWRSSEFKELQFRNLDFEAGEVRLEPGTTKSREGRAFPMFSKLRVLLEKRLRLAQELRKKGVGCTHCSGTNATIRFSRPGVSIKLGRRLAGKRGFNLVSSLVLDAF